MGDQINMPVIQEKAMIWEKNADIVKNI